MYERLFKWTGPKIIKSLEANVAAIRADLLNQQASFSLESQRLERLRRNIAHCTVKAPGDGIVVYANRRTGWGGMASVVIDEGVTLREKQPIFNLPDPQHMRVRAKINESKVALVQTNQPGARHRRRLPRASPEGDRGRSGADLDTDPRLGRADLLRQRGHHRGIREAPSRTECRDPDRGRTAPGGDPRARRIDPLGRQQGRMSPSTTRPAAEAGGSLASGGRSRSG